LKQGKKNINDYIVCIGTHNKDIYSKYSTVIVRNVISEKRSFLNAPIIIIIIIHDRVCAQLHFNICKETRVQLDKKHWYEHVIKSVKTSQEGKVTIFWNQQLQTDRTIPKNIPDIAIRDNEKGTCVLIDVEISGDRNVIKMGAEILKYKDLTIEIQRMWNVKTKVIPVVIGATGTVSKSFRKYASNIPGKHEVKALQKTSILGTAHILRKVLM